MRGSQPDMPLPPSSDEHPDPSATTGVPGTRAAAGDGVAARIAEALASLVGGGDDAAERRAALGSLGRSLGHAGRGAVAHSQPMVQTLIDAAPRIPVRNLALLRAQHDGLDGEALAEALVESAAKRSAAIGAATGAVVSAQWFAAPTMLAVPAEILAETVAVAMVEVKLLAELHAVYGVPLPGNATQRGSALVRAWAERRGVDPLKPGTITTALGGPARRHLRKRLLRRAGTNVTSAGPLLTGAAVGAFLNRRATRGFAMRVRADLRVQSARSSQAQQGAPSGSPQTAKDSTRRF